MGIFKSIRRPTAHALGLRASFYTKILLKSIRAHLDPGSACVNCLYSGHILYLWYTFLMGHTANV